MRNLQTAPCVYWGEGPNFRVQGNRGTNMNKLIAGIAGMVLIGAIGAGTAQAQGVNIRIEKGNKTVEINAGRPAPRVAPQGHYITVKKKVWVEARYETVYENVWVPGTCEVIVEQVLIPASCKIITERVWVPGHYVTVCETRVDARGRAYHVDVRRYVPGSYQTRQREVHVPARYETRQRHVDIPGRYEKREKRVLVPGHFKVVEERVFVQADNRNHPRHQVDRGRSTR